MAIRTDFLLVGTIFLYFLRSVHTTQSIWDIRINSSMISTSTIFPNYLYKNSYVAARIVCAAEGKDEIQQVSVTWIFRQVSCMEEMYRPNLKQYQDLMALEFQTKASFTQKSKKKMLDDRAMTTTTTPAPSVNVTSPGGNNATEDRKLPPIAFQISSNQIYSCSRSNNIRLKNENDQPYRKIIWKDGSDVPDVLSQNRDMEVSKLAERVVVSAWEDGMYHFQLSVVPTQVNQVFEADVTVEMHGSYGYLSAIDWPLLPFNGVMAFLYLILSTIWIMVWARSHRFTLKIHIAMGLVAVSGAMSTTLMFVQHASDNTLTGGVTLIMWFAKILTVLQLTCLNMVLMIVSTGYGISVPTLPRRSLIKMASVCVLQFLVGITWFVCTDTTLLVQYSFPTFTKVTLWLKVAIFAVIAAWIMVSSIRTLMHLRQRRHAGLKIITFTIFMATCILAFIAHVTTFGLSLGWMQACRTNWKLQWVFNSVPQIEALVLLIVLMVLWRPVDTAQSYAFAPLGMEQVAGDSEEEDSENELYSKETDKIKLDEL